MIDARNFELYLTPSEYHELKPISKHEISNADWNKPPKNITLLHIALYIIEMNPKPRYDINKDRLKKIRKKVLELRYRKTKGDIKIFEYDYYSPTDSSEFYWQIDIANKLGKYAKYFTNDYANNDRNGLSYNDVRQKKKRYIISKYPACSLEDDEVSVVALFLKHMEYIKDELTQMYIEAKEMNKITSIDYKIQDMLLARLEKVKTSSTKAKRLATQTITAIKKEILA